MSRIATTFAALRARNETALIPFLMAGDPDLDTTLRLAHAVEENGADLLEIGIPFSDPIADGPVLQRSAERALQHGTSLPRILELVQEFRRTSNLPVILFGYYNPIFRYGPQRFAADARRAGADACLVVDLPPEEADELQTCTDASGLDMIFLLAPTSGKDRIRKIVARARGFVYYVSLTGVTGARTSLPTNLEAMVSSLRKSTSLPIGVGFGISSPAHAAAVGAFSDAVIVGSAIMKLVEDHRDDGHAVELVGRFVASLKEALHGRAEEGRAAR